MNNATRFDVPAWEIQNIIIAAIFVLVVIFSMKDRRKVIALDHGVSTELKGVAILSIIFAHIAFFLSNQDKFLFPFSHFAGVGVNIFLFLSGFGLTSSFLLHSLNLMHFIARTIKKLYLPLWVSLVGLLILDKVFLGINYDIQTILNSLGGIFLRADIYLDINSPMWYFTLSLFYYITFPIIFWIFKKSRLLITLMTLAITLIFLNLKLPVTDDLLTLYQLHFLAFPIGVIFRLFFYEMFINLLSKIHSQWVKLGVIVLAIASIIILTINSGVGKEVNKEQLTSLLMVFALIIIFVLKQREIWVFRIFGKYSQQIFLIHWPFLYRYDVLFNVFPAWLAICVSLVILLCLGWGLRRLVLELS